MPDKGDGGVTDITITTTPTATSHENPSQVGSTSDFSPRRPEVAIPRSIRGISGYTSRSPRSYTSLNDRGRSDRRAGPSSYARSSSASRSISRSTTAQKPSELDNWQSLRDIVIIPQEEEDQDDIATIHGVESPHTPRTGRGESSRSLRSFFSLPITSPVSIQSRRDSETRTIEGVLSTSPTQLDGTVDPLRAHGSGLERLSEDGDSTEREDAQAGDESVKSPLLGDNANAETSKPGAQPAPLKHVSTSKNYWPPSPVVIAILKCAITYFLASLFTFVPHLARLLSTSSEIDAHGRVAPKPAYSAHMVATIVVYFNPAKTVGNMFLATRFCVVLACLAAAVSLLAMLTVHLFDHFSPSQGSKWDLISEIGDWTVCIVWIGGSMGLLAWLKVWVSNPSFNSGCSMAAVTIYTVVIKEGAIPKLLEVLLIVLIGAIITNVTCYLVFPSSATSRLESSISTSLQSFSTLLDLLTNTFLLKKSAARDNRTPLKDAIKSHAAAFNKLKTDLAEAKNERLIDSRIRGHKLELYDALVGSLTRLAQHLAGLRGGTRLQEDLFRASRDGLIQLERLGGRGTAYNVSMPVNEHVGSSEPGSAANGDIKRSVELFTKFREMAGCEMELLVDHCEEALEAVQSISKRRIQTSEGIEDIRKQLSTSLKAFNTCCSKAIKQLYAGPRRQKGLYEAGNDSQSETDQSRPSSPSVAENSTDEGPNETVFLIYFFLFTLEEFARELLFLLDTFSQILDTERMSTTDYIMSLLPSKRGRKERRADYLYKQLRQVVPIDPSQLQPALFPRKAQHGRDSLIAESPAGTSYLGRIKQQFWAFGDWLRKPNVRYAMKTGIGGALLAAPAYTEVGRPIFLHYRGEWALIAYFSAISPTVGQTNFLSFFRVIGTLVGATVAVLFYTVFPENPVLLPILGVIFSLPCFYVITQMPDYAQAGRFTLLTYNLTCLYAYNSRERDVSAFSIAFRRSTSVILGVIWAAIVSRYWWPFTARRELRMGLSDFCLDLSYLYSKLVTTYSRGVDGLEPLSAPFAGQAEREPLLPIDAPKHLHLNPGIRQFMAMELHLQTQIGSLRSLLAQTKNEPRLKGPFPSEFYQEVLLSCERILDQLHSMRCVTTREEWDEVRHPLSQVGRPADIQSIREEFVIPVNKERREMAGNVILYFYTLSAGFRLRTPMPPYFPPAEQARQRLVEAIRGLDVVKRRGVRGGSRHLLFFAYALAMQEVIAELEYLGELMQDAFGVISQSTVVDFEELFQSAPASNGRAETERD